MKKAAFFCLSLCGVFVVLSRFMLYAMVRFKPYSLLLSQVSGSHRSPQHLDIEDVTEGEPIDSMLSNTPQPLPDLIDHTTNDQRLPRVPMPSNVDSLVEGESLQSLESNLRKSSRRPRSISSVYKVSFSAFLDVSKL